VDLEGSMRALSGGPGSRGHLLRAGSLRSVTAGQPAAGQSSSGWGTFQGQGSGEPGRSNGLPRSDLHGTPQALPALLGGAPAGGSTRRRLQGQRSPSGALFSYARRPAAPLPMQGCPATSSWDGTEPGLNCLCPSAGEGDGARAGGGGHL